MKFLQNNYFEQRTDIGEKEILQWEFISFPNHHKHDSPHKPSLYYFSSNVPEQTSAWQHTLTMIR